MCVGKNVFSENAIFVQGIFVNLLKLFLGKKHVRPGRIGALAKDAKKPARSGLLPPESAMPGNVPTVMPLWFL